MMKTNLALSKSMKDACNSAGEASDSAGQIMRAMDNAILNVTVHRLDGIEARMMTCYNESPLRKDS
jgi:hypothetical protein